MKKYKQSHPKRKLWAEIITLLLLAGILLPKGAFLSENSDYAVFSLELDKRTFLNPDKIEFDLRINASGTPINAVEAMIDFEPSKLELTASDSKNSFCQVTVKEAIDNKAGSYFLACGQASSSQENNIQLARLIFKKIESGWTDIAVNSASQAALADGKGTNLAVYGGEHKIYILK